VSAWRWESRLSVPSTAVSDLNYLGMPKLVEPIWEDTLAATGLDPIKTAAEAKTITASRWDEVMKKEKPSAGQGKPAARTPRRHPQKRAASARTPAAKPAGEGQVGAG
jgi:hypothetical protein